MSVPTARPSVTELAAPARKTMIPVGAPLFELGRTWYADITSASEHWDGQANRNVATEQKSKAACEVVRVTTLSWATVSTITCTGLMDNGVPPPIAGFWIATEDGLYRTDTEPTSPRELTPVRLVFAFPVQPSDRTTHDPDMPRHGERRTVQADGDRWCHNHASWGGDEGWQVVCLDNVTGLARARWGWSGGSTHDSVLTVEKSQGRPD